MELFDMFKIAKKIELKDGAITLMNAPVNIIPTSLFKDVQDDLINSVGFVRAYNLVYNNAKMGGQTFNQQLLKTHKFKDKRDILEWQRKVMMFAGWGKWKLQNFEPEKNSITAQFTDSPFTKAYPKSNFPVDIIPVGFSAGGISTCFKADLECIETKCQAMGDDYCQIEVCPKEIIENKRNELWKQWKLI
jgi:predicted hydrocarbon binding protein